jgi:predicted NAD/FAD-binding protein
VGGGLAGVSLAYLLDGVCDVVLLEAQPRLGGHAHTVEIEHGAKRFCVDLGAQLFSPRLQPRFVELLTTLGIYDPAAPDSGGTITRDMGITLGDYGAPRPRFVSPMFWQRTWPLRAPWNLPASLGFFAFALHARKFERDGDWSVVLDEFLRGVPGLSAEQRERVLLPWLAAMTGCSITDARGPPSRPAILSISSRKMIPLRSTRSMATRVTWSMSTSFCSSSVTR